MSNGTYTRDMFDSTKRYRGVLLQRSTAGRPVYIVDSDFTDWAKIIQAQQQDLGRFFADGTEDAGMAISGSEGRSNDFYIMPGRGLCNGLIPEVHTSTPYTCDVGSGFSNALADQIHRRWTVVNDGVLSDAHALYNTNALVGYYVVIGEDAYQVTANTATSISLSGFTASTVTSPYYYIRLKTPAATVDQDVWLDCHLEDWGVAEDSDLDHNPGGNPVECARRLKLVQSVLVQQGNFVTISSSGYDKHGYLDASGTQHWCLRLGHLARTTSEYLLTANVVADPEFYAGSHPEVVAARDNGLFNAYESTNLADRLKRDRVAITVGKSSELGQYTGDDGLMQAVSAYAKIIVLKAGDYTLLADLDIPEGCLVVGENKATVTITVPLGNSINLGANAALMRVKLLRASGTATAPVVLLDGVESKLLDCTIVDGSTSEQATVAINGQNTYQRTAKVEDCKITKSNGICIQVLPLAVVSDVDRNDIYSLVCIHDCVVASAAASSAVNAVVASEAGVVDIRGCNFRVATGALSFEGKAADSGPDQLLVSNTTFHRPAGSPTGSDELVVVFGGEANFTDCVFTFADKTASSAIGATVKLRDYDTAAPTALFSGCRLEAGSQGFDIRSSLGGFVQLNNCDIDMLAYSTSGVYVLDSTGKVQVTNSRVKMSLGGGANQAFNCDCDLRLSGVDIFADAAYAIRQNDGVLTVNNSVINCSAVAMYLASGVVAKVIGGEVNALTFVQSAGAGSFSAANCNITVTGDAFTGSTAAIELTGCTVNATDNLTAAACVPSRLSLVGSTINASATSTGLAQGGTVDLRSTNMTAYLPVVKGSNISVVGSNLIGASAPAIYAASSTTPTVISLRGSSFSASSGVKACVIQDTTTQPVHLVAQGCVFANGVDESVADGATAAVNRSLMLLLGAVVSGTDTTYNVTLQGCTFGYGVFVAPDTSGTQSNSAGCILTINDCHMGNAGLFDSASTNVNITGGTFSTAVCVTAPAVNQQATSAIYLGPTTNSAVAVTSYMVAKAGGSFHLNNAIVTLTNSSATGFTKAGLTDAYVLRQAGVVALCKYCNVSGLTITNAWVGSAHTPGVMLGTVYASGGYSKALAESGSSFCVKGCYFNNCIAVIGLDNYCKASIVDCDFNLYGSESTNLLPAVVVVPDAGTSNATCTIASCRNVGAIDTTASSHEAAPGIYTPVYAPTFTPDTTTKLAVLTHLAYPDESTSYAWPWSAAAVTTGMRNFNTLNWAPSTTYSPSDWPTS